MWRKCVAIGLLLAMLPTGWLVSPSVDTARAQTARNPSLKETLEKGLRARLPGEFSFIAKVVALVTARRLPRSMVLATFKWARRKKPYPFPYFERAIRIQAKKLGVTIG